MTIYEMINGLMQYGEDKGIYEGEDKEYILNSLLAIFNLDDYKDNDYIYDKDNDVTYLLDEMLEYAISNNVIEGTQVNKDLFDTKIMGCLMPLPSMINKKFNDLKSRDSVLATDYFYNLCKDVNYIRTTRIAKNIEFPYMSKYGKIDITINLSKPEKDPNDIKKLLNMKKVNYPNCMLCKENVNYKGRLDFPARQNLRFVPVTLDNKQFYIQYSPYSYYNEHTICFKEEHSNMKVDIETVKELVDFVSQFPHYFMGSNAGLPIVGGSILNHHHFQGGKAIFPMDNANEEFIKINDEVEYNLLNWPLNVIRLRSENKDKLIKEAEKIFSSWNIYENKDLMIIANDENGSHNAITPICRYRNGCFELDLALRNNITTVDRPLGLYHPREEYWNIKKENIGLIEVMGLAILPSRLKDEMKLVRKYLLEDKLSEEEYTKFKIHLDFANNIANNNKVNSDNVDNLINDEIGRIFTLVLEDCAVFKKDSINVLKEWIKNL